MHLNTVPFLLAAALLSGALAGELPSTSAPIAVNATVNDACEITLVPEIQFSYSASDGEPAIATGAVDVRCNLQTTPFLAYWDSTQANTDGSFNLKSGDKKLTVSLTASDDYTTVKSDSDAGGSRYSYGLTVTASANQWSASTGQYTATFDYLVGW